jgi:hypothetical protein
MPAEPTTAPSEDPDRSPCPPAVDIPLTSRELDDLLDVFARVYPTQQAADRVLNRIGFPRDMRPGFTSTPLEAWEAVFTDLGNGVLDRPNWRLLEAISRTYSRNPVVRPMAIRHGLLAADPLYDTPDPGSAQASPSPFPPADASPVSGPAADGGTSHLIVRASTEVERDQAWTMLQRLDLAPREVWSTAHAVSYALDDVGGNDLSDIRRRLEGADPEGEIGWTLVPPGQPDYLLHTLYVTGPDGRRFRFHEAPAQQSVRNVAAEVLDGYGLAQAERPTVIDQVAPDGSTNRLTPDDTLHDAGVKEGDSLRVGLVARAGGSLEAPIGPRTSSSSPPLMRPEAPTDRRSPASGDQSAWVAVRDPGLALGGPRVGSGRALAADLPHRADADCRISLIVRVVADADPTAPGLLRMQEPVPEQGRTIVVTVSATGLTAEGDLEQELFVPACGDSDPIRFGFRTRELGLQDVLVRAFLGGTFLGELVVQISVQTGAGLREGRTATGRLAALATEPGEVTLQVMRQEGRYQFQFLGERFSPMELCQLTSDPVATVEHMAAELREMARNAAASDPRTVRRRLRNLGAMLWGSMVPRVIREEYWDQVDRITSFTIATDLDMIPWELLYPVDGTHENGFLIEQFPVVRRVFGQGRARALRLGPAAYVVPPSAPEGAREEVAGVCAALGTVPVPPVLDNMQAVEAILEDGAPGLVHFACHNTFTAETGSSIAFEDGMLRPTDLSLVVQRRALELSSPLIFLNACRSAGEVHGLSDLSGWASQFLRAGAGAFIGTLWAVRSGTAREFAQEFYRLLNGPEPQPLGSAVLAARRSVAEESGDPTWLAYTVYGNPFATVARN